MTDDFNRPLTWRGQGADRPAPGPQEAGDPGSTFPRDETQGSQRTDRPFEGGGAATGAGAPQAVDPGLADQAPGGPAPSPYDQTGSGPATHDPATPGAATTSTGAGAPVRADGGAPGQTAGSSEGASSDRFRERWASVQGAFVDDPKAAVVEADRLVAEVIYDLEQKLTRRREHMQGQWKDGEADTEQLRQHLHGYRALFHKVLETDV